MGYGESGSHHVALLSKGSNRAKALETGRRRLFMVVVMRARQSINSPGLDISSIVTVDRHRARRNATE